jgi:outer membrane receptor for ferrienterochelin and colicin
LNEGKTAFNFSAKTSWINLYVDRLIKNNTQYDDIDIGYKDVTFKLSHRFTPSTKISYTHYAGNDKISLNRFEGVYLDVLNYFEFDESNTLDWGSTVSAINYEQVLSDKLFLKVHGGRVSYDFFSNGNYEFSAFRDTIGDLRILDVTTQTDILDYSIGTALEYYVSGNHKLKSGFSYINHRYNPALKTSDIRIGEDSREVEGGINQYNANELAFYIDDDLRLSNKLRIHSGIRLSIFQVDGVVHRNLEPRFSLQYNVQQRMSLTASASRMTQNVHLLVNPGIGLPSDLWVPSTAEIKPELSDQVALSWKYFTKGGYSYEVSGYYRRMQNLLEYTTAIDLFYAILNDNNVVPIEVQNRGWEERVKTGNGSSRGLELTVQKRSGRLTGWLAYTLSMTDRTFAEINNGNPFPYRYDRRHDVNIGLSYQLHDRIGLTASWVYGSGYAFTLGAQEIEVIGGPPIVVTNGRNNRRLAAFHHLDFQANWLLSSPENPVTLRIGMYNVYNRLNPYFIYLYENKVTEERNFRQVSLFPFLPSITLSYEF